ncbi:MAG: biopolymer transporter ExbD [Elusimicrobiota bacterium]
MGMQSGSSQGPITDINVTPLVGVCLVLVIIFMVIAPFALQAGIEVSSTRMGAAKGKAALERNVRVLLDEKRRLQINGEAVSWEDFDAKLRAAVSRSADKLVSVDASPKAQVSDVVEILDMAKQNGARRLALLNP